MAGNTAVECVNCALYDLRKQYPDAVMKEHRAGTQDVSPLVFSEVWRERSQGLEHELKDDFISAADSAEFHIQTERRRPSAINASSARHEKARSICPGLLTNCRNLIS